MPDDRPGFWIITIMSWSPVRYDQLITWEIYSMTEPWFRTD